MSKCRNIGLGLLTLIAAATAVSAPASAQQQLAQPSTAKLRLFQARVKEIGGALQNTAQLETYSQMQREDIVDFVVGNMLFVLLHESAHNVITEFKLPVLGRQEDAADEFAVLALLKVGTPMSHRVLVQAARGWFLSQQRDKDGGETPVYYDEHGLDAQRAFHIVCLMVGSDPDKFADLANDTKMPKERQQTCKKDYDDASTGWDAVLKTYLRAPDQPKTNIDVVYGAGKGNLDVYAQGLRSVELLEIVKNYLSDAFALPTAFTMEMQTCGFINARWIPSTRKLTACYELAADFSDLYRVRGVKLRSAIVTMQIDDQPGYVPDERAEKLPANYQRQVVFYRTPLAPGTVIVNEDEHFLYVVQGNNRALRYAIGVGRDCFQASGLMKVSRKAEWPEWSPSPQTIARHPDLPHFMEGGPGNPMGARALYLGNMISRINGTNQPQTIGQSVPSGCFRLVDNDVIDLYGRVPLGAKVIVRQLPET